MDMSTGARVQALMAFEDDGMQLMALEELNQMLSMGQQGDIRVSAYVPALVKVMERASGNAQVVLMATRALIQIVDIEPRAGALAVGEGVIPVLCSRLLSISDLDVAEQCLKCLHILSSTHARDVLDAGGLKAVTAFFDFFPIHLQRRAAETAAMLCLDAARQIDDAVNVLEALPSLQLCLESPDERVLAAATQSFARLVSCYSSNSSTRQKNGYHHLTLEAMRALQAYTNSSSIDHLTAANYVDFDITPFQPRYSPNWKLHVLTLICTNNVVPRIISLLRKNTAAAGDESVYILTALSRIARACPHTIPIMIEEGVLDVLETKLSATGSSKSGEGLTNALRLVQSMLPPVPHSKSFDRSQNGELCDRDEYDASLILSLEERQQAETRRKEMIERYNYNREAEQQHGSEIGDMMVVETEDDSIWACSLCTYHNPKSASSCDMCGQVSPQIAERASRLENSGGSSSASQTNSSKQDPSDLLEKLSASWKDASLGIASCSQLYREQPELLERFIDSVLPNLSQVAAKSANPEQRTRALGGLSSLLYCAPRPLLEKIAKDYGPGGDNYAGIVHSGLQSHNPHIVSSALRVSMVELWRLGISPELMRENIPSLIRGLSARFPEPATGSRSSESERINSLRRRASAWLSYYDYLNNTLPKPLLADYNASESPASKLKAIADELNELHSSEINMSPTTLEQHASSSSKLAMEDVEPPPTKKRRRLVAQSISPVLSSRRILPKSAARYRRVLGDLNEILAQGVVANEFQSSGVPQILARLSNSSSEFVQSLKEAFSSDSSQTSLIRTLHDALDGSERLVVIKHGDSNLDSLKALKSPSRVVLRPTPSTLRRLALNLKSILPTAEGTVPEDIFSFAIKVDPLARVDDVESHIWQQLKSRVIELRVERKPGQKRGQHLFGTSASSYEPDRNEQYAIIQAGDPIHVEAVLKPGIRVTRGRDWKWDDQDGGPGRIGEVIDVRNWNEYPDSCIRVRWNANKSTNVYRYNVEDAFDIALAPRTPKHRVKPSGKSTSKVVNLDSSKKSTEEFRRALKRGDEIDAMDSFHRWYRAVVRVLVPKKESREGAVRVSFHGFSPRFDEWILLSSERIAPLGSRIFQGGFTSGEVDDDATKILEQEAEILGTPLIQHGSLDNSSVASALLDSDGSTSQQIKELSPSVHIRIPETDVVLQIGRTVQLKRAEDDDWWTAVILQLGTKSKNEQLTSSRNLNSLDNNANNLTPCEETKTDDSPYHSASDEEDLTMLTQLSFNDISLYALLKQVHNTGNKEDYDEDDDDEEEEEEEDDYDQVEWVDISSSNVQLRSLKAPSAITHDTETAIGPGIEMFAKVAILGKEAWVPVVVVADADEQDAIIVKTRFGEESLESTFTIQRLHISITPPRTGYAPSAKDIKTLLKTIREMDDADSLSQLLVSGLPLGRLLQRNSGALTSTTALANGATTTASSSVADDYDKEDMIDDEPVSSSPLPHQKTPIATIEKQLEQSRRHERARAFFASARSRTLMRDYSGVDISADPLSSSLHQTLSAAAAISSRLSLGIGEDALADGKVDGGGVKTSSSHPVRLTSRRDYNETIHLCIARIATSDDSSNGSSIVSIDYAIDFSDPAFEALQRSISSKPSNPQEQLGGMYEFSGSVAMLEDGTLIAESDFPTICRHGVQLAEEGSWYYEVEIVRAGLAQIGWIDSAGSCDDDTGRGCGDDEHSWAFDGKRRVKWNKESRDWGAHWVKGDVIGVALRIKPENTLDIYFSRNGSFDPPMGLAFENVKFTGAVRPALTFNKTFNCKFRARDFVYLPPDETYKPIGEVGNSQVSSEQESTVDDMMSVETPVVDGDDGEEEDGAIFETILDVAHPLPPAAQVLRAMLDLGLASSELLVNRRLTNKLVWQLQDALAVCSGALPRWCFRAVHEFPFLFPLETRQNFFSLTALGVSRVLFKFTNELEQDSTRHRSRLGSDSYSSSIQLKRQKVVLPRERALEVGIILMRKFASNKCVLTMEFSEEIGHGLGPTLEFYSIVCRELQRKDLGLWRYANHAAITSPAMEVQTISEDSTENPADVYIFATNGLFPAALSPSSPKHIKSRVLELFRFLGRFIARAVLDDRLLDLDFSEPFLEYLVGESDIISQQSSGDIDESDLEENLVNLGRIDLEYSKSLRSLLDLCTEYDDLSLQPSSPETERSMEEIRISIDCLELDNILPGTEDVHIPGFVDEAVTVQNCREYVKCVASFLCKGGVYEQIQACREGFAEAFSPHTLRAFSISELRDWLGGARDEGAWSIQEIEDNMVLRDYVKESVQITNLLEILSDFSKEERRLFLRFLTGTPRLPVGGWSALRPKLSIVRKTGNDSKTLPSCSTCSVVLKLPEYDTKEILREKLIFAIREGQNYFSMD